MTAKILPTVFGDELKAHPDKLPADSPKIVILLGFPPKN